MGMPLYYPPPYHRPTGEGCILTSRRKCGNFPQGINHTTGPASPPLMGEGQGGGKGL